jgi:hypothetical protein
LSPADSLDLPTAFFSIMDSSFTVAKICNTTIFEVLEQNAESVISVINYIIEKGGESGVEPGTQGGTGRRSNNGVYYDQNGVKHVPVSMATASGGWY